MNNHQAEVPVFALALSILSGLWLMTMSAMWYQWPENVDSWMWHRGMMNTYGMFGSLGWFGAIAGLVIIISAVLLAAQPSRKNLWGALIVVFSLANIFIGMGGFIAGSVGIVGGLLAIAHKA